LQNQLLRKAASGRPDSRTLRRAQRAAQLTDAALECISTLGLRETTVQDVAARAGMAVGSISQYFDSKEMLFTAVLRALAEEFEAAWRVGVAAAGDDAALRLRRFVECYFAPSICQRKKIAVWFAFWGEVKARPQYREVCAVHDRTHDRMLETLCEGLADETPGLPAASAAKLVASTCHGLWLEFLTGADGLRRTDLEMLALRQLAALYPHHASHFGGDAGAN